MLQSVPVAMGDEPITQTKYVCRGAAQHMENILFDNGGPEWCLSLTMKYVWYQPAIRKLEFFKDLAEAADNFKNDYTSGRTRARIFEVFLD